MKPDDLAEKVCERFESDDILEIARQAGIKIIFRKWFPVTVGEFDWKTKTICVNENAEIEKEKIIAHELGHYFLRKCELKDFLTNEEIFCDEFAAKLLSKRKNFAPRA